MCCLLAVMVMRIMQDFRVVPNIASQLSVRAAFKACKEIQKSSSGACAVGFVCWVRVLLLAAPAAVCGGGI